jgi:cytochrome c oxidase subunit 2
MSLILENEEDIEAVAAHVASLPPQRPAPVVEGGDPARGREIFTLCTQCHGPEARGNPQTFAPPLAWASDWYLLTQLKHFKSGVRGASPGDTTGVLMRPMAGTLVDEQAMRDVISYIMTLSD